MLYYFVTVKCIHCHCPCPWGVAAETEPPPDAKITIYCPQHGGPIPVPFRCFKQVDELPPGTPIDPYPPPPPPPKPRWWQFWKW